MTERGQAHTLEAITAAMLLLASIGFALQMTSVTPLSASTSSQHVENQIKATSQGVLASEAKHGGLSRAVRYWNHDNGTFHNSSTGDSYYTGQPPDNSLGRALNQTLGERNVAYNVYVVWQNQNGTERRQRMIYRGVPSDHAVHASRAVTLTDEDPLLDEDGTVNRSFTVKQSDTFYMEDAGTEVGGNRVLYNQARIEVIAWRI